MPRRPLAPLLKVGPLVCLRCGGTIASSLATPNRGPILKGLTHFSAEGSQTPCLLQHPFRLHFPGNLPATCLLKALLGPCLGLSLPEVATEIPVHRPAAISRAFLVCRREGDGSWVFHDASA